MLLKLIAFELKFHFKQTSYLLFTILFFLSGIYLAVQEGAINPENRYNIHLFTSLISLASVFQIAFQTGYTVLRDKINNCTELIHATSVPKFQFLVSRFLGIFITASFSTLMYTVALILATSIDPFQLYSEINLRILSFVWPWLLIVLPNVFFLTALLSTVALFTKKVASIFFVGVLIFILFWVNNSFIGSPFTGGRLVVDEQIIEKVAILDILGLCTSYEQTQFWSPLEKNSELVKFSGAMALNRILWVSIGVLCFLTSYFSFSFKLSQYKKSSYKCFRLLNPKKTKTSELKKRTYKQVFTNKQSFKANFKEFNSLVGMDLKSTIFSKVFILLCVVWVGMLMAAMVSNIEGQGVYGNVLPTTGLLAGLILEPLAHIGLFLIVFYAGELVWKSRQYAFNEILDVTPTRNRILVLSKYIALFLLPIFIIGLGILISVLIQASYGYSVIDLGLYLSIFYYGGSALFIYGILTVFMQQLVKNKYVGMLLSLVLIYGLGYSLPAFGIQHPLASILQLPKIGEGYSAFIGYGQQVVFFNWMNFIWVSLSLIIVLITFKIYKRNTEQGSMGLFKLMVSNWKVSQRVALLILLGMFCISAVIIDSKSDAKNYSDEVDFFEYYEKKYSKYQNKAHPVVTSVKTKVLLKPKQLEYEVEGVYTLLNNTEELIDTILVAAQQKLNAFSISGTRLIDEDTTLVDAKFLVFEPALLPGQTKEMIFKTRKRVGDFELQRDIVANGTYLQNSAFEPRFGYMKAFEITNKVERKKRGLSENNKKETLSNYKFENTTRPKQDFETWVTTSKDQTAIAPGKLIGTSETDEMVTYHYKSQVKTDNNISYFSSKYDITKEEHKGISIEVYHLPEHSANVKEIVNAAKATLDYGNANFGNYPFDHLRIAEVPLYWKFGGHALPGTIAFQERFFTQDISNQTKGINQLSRVVIHEIGHQWFGHKMSPAPGRGANMLTETMANYIEAQVLEKIYGKTMVRRLANFGRRRYFSFRSSADIEEPSLHLVNNETYISYRKGFLAMQSLKELIGEPLQNSILKDLIDQNEEEQSARSIDFINLLQSKIDSEKQDLVNDWFRKRVVYDLAITDVNYNAVENDLFELEVRILANRFETDLDGRKNKIGINEVVTIAFYQNDPDDPNASPIVKTLRLNSDENVFTFNLIEIPRYVVLDPMITRLEEDVSNNIFKIIQD